MEDAIIEVDSDRVDVRMRLQLLRVWVNTISRTIGTHGTDGILLTDEKTDDRCEEAPERNNKPKRGSISRILDVGKVRNNSGIRMTSTSHASDCMSSNVDRGDTQRREFALAENIGSFEASGNT